MQSLGTVLLICALLAAIATMARARDVDGRYAGSPLHGWFESLQSKSKSPCCSDADGQALEDPDWKTIGDHYAVRVDGKWMDVPPDTVVPPPNLAGRAYVWPVRDHRGFVWIRCFMPGPEG